MMRKMDLDINSGFYLLQPSVTGEFYQIRFGQGMPSFIIMNTSALAYLLFNR